MRQLKGITFVSDPYLSNVQQFVTHVGMVEEVGDYFKVSGFVKLFVTEEEQNGEKIPILRFDHVFRYFADNTSSMIGIDTELHRSSCFTYDLTEEIVEAYYAATNRIKPASIADLSKFRK